MNPLSIAGAFATIIGLLCNFKNEQRTASENEYNSFIKWLIEKKHDQVIEFLKENSSLSESIKAFLNENNEIIMRKLNSIDEIVSNIASNIEGLSEIVRAINPNLRISEQCISLLKQLDESGASSFMEVKDRRNKYLQLHDGGSGDIHFEEPRFLEDDLNTLVEYGFLRLEFIGSGSRVFHLTRQAVEFLQLI